MDQKKNPVSYEKLMEYKKPNHINSTAHVVYGETVTVVSDIKPELDNTEVIDITED